MGHTIKVSDQTISVIRHICDPFTVAHAAEDGRRRLFSENYYY